MLFSYKAKLKTGEIVEGTMEMGDRFALSRELRLRGYTPIAIEEKNKTFDLTLFLNRIISRVSVSEQIVFTKNLSGMLHAGLPLSRALSVLEKQTANHIFNDILITLQDEINAGGTLSSGLAKYPNVFSSLFVSMTKAGEESGNLSGALSDISDNLEKAHSLSKKIHGALIYPGVILSAMVIIGILMFAFVVPTLAGTFKELGVTLPTSTRILIWVGTFFANHLLLTFILLFALCFGVFALLRAKFVARYMDFIVPKLPIIGNLDKELNTARTARTMSSLLRSGVSITRAIEITSDVVQNIYYKKILQDSKIAVEKGSPFSEVFKINSKFYPVMMSEMVQVGEETGKLSDMLSDIAVFYENEIENKTKNLSTVIEPVLMVVIGSGVGFFAISMVSPLYSILGNIQ